MSIARSYKKTKKCKDRMFKLDILWSKKYFQLLVVVIYYLSSSRTIAYLNIWFSFEFKLEYLKNKIWNICFDLLTQLWPMVTEKWQLGLKIHNKNENISASLIFVFIFTRVITKMKCPYSNSVKRISYRYAIRFPLSCFSFMTNWSLAYIHSSAKHF